MPEEGITEFSIGKSNSFLYAIRDFDQYGKLLMTLEYHNVEFIDNMSNELFEIPKDAKISIIKTGNDYTNAMVEAFPTSLENEAKKTSFACYKLTGYVFIV